MLCDFLLVPLKIKADADNCVVKAFKSTWSFAESAGVLISLYTFRSSAKMVNRLDSTAGGRSFTYRRNSAGPSIEPCGTPDVIVNALDVAPGTVTRCKRSVRYELNHWRRGPPKPSLRTLCTSSLWFTLSNAFDMSRYAKHLFVRHCRGSDQHTPALQ